MNISLNLLTFLPLSLSYQISLDEGLLENFCLFEYVFILFSIERYFHWV